MGIRSLPLAALVIMLSTVFVSAADEFTGDLTINAKSLNVRQVHALLHDNAEGLLSSPKQLRILIADRELSIDSLYGTSFPPVVEMGGRGEVQGVLLRIDPSDYRYVDLTILLVKGLQTVTERVSIKNFSITGKRLNASFEYADNSFASDPDYPKVKFSFQISTVIHDLPAVTADLKGPAALKSPQLAALRAIVDTLVVGDFAALEKLITKRAARGIREQVAALGSGAKAAYKKVGTDFKGRIPGVKRIVVRGDRAVVILPGKASYDLVLEGGIWKGD
jgi:hypothetical protein